MELDCQREKTPIYPVIKYLLSAYYVLGTIQGSRDIAMYKTIAEQEQAGHLPDMIFDRTQNTNNRIERNEIESKRTGNVLKLQGLKCYDVSNQEKDIWCELNSFCHYS